jgi:3'-5' exonuclease
MKLSSILFLDIETVSAAADFQSLNPRMQELWNKKARHITNADELSDAELYEQRAAIYSEFARVVCIGLGYLIMEGDQIVKARVKAIANDDEQRILQEFSSLLREHQHHFTALCAHNGKEFDFPFLSRRMVVNQVPLPPQLDISGKKPWEVQHWDTMELWKFGDRKNYTSLDMLAALFEVDSPKQGIDGSMVSTIYHKEQGLDRITAYCKSDVVALINVYLRMQYQPILPMDKFEIM